MPKSKKAKTYHASSHDSSNPSQAEIWDDSALIRSWNDAVAEYEYYHSIAARGEDVEQVLHMAELAEANGEPATSGLGLGLPKDLEVQDGQVAEETSEAEEGEIDEQAPTVTNGTQADILSDLAPQANVFQHQHSNDDSHRQTQAAVQPSAAPHDQALENIKMAYYWAGYYSGLYDGQKQAAAATTAAPTAAPSTESQG